MNVLLVDDEPLELDQLEYLIQPTFPYWNIHKAGDAAQALSLFRETNFQLAFLDINLPGMSGLELGKILKDQNQNIDLVIVTAHHDFQFTKKSIRLGVIDYITKPIIQHELAYVLKRFENHSLQGYSKEITDVLMIIHDRYSEKITLGELALEVYMNPSYLSRRFHEEVNMPLIEYLIDYRIQKAKEILITNMDWSISKVANQTGFNSQHYFSTVFRKIEGVSPKIYREQNSQLELPKF